MNVIVEGPNGGKVDRHLSAAVCSAVRSYVKQLGIDRLKLNLTIRAHHKRAFDGCEGLCEYVDKRTFIIDLCMYANWMPILAHEMVHVRQYARGQLSPSMNRWESLMDVDDLDYNDQPWEQEAFALQNKMVAVYEGREI